MVKKMVSTVSVLPRTTQEYLMEMDKEISVSLFSAKSPEEVRMGITNGEDVNARGFCGRTPLMKMGLVGVPNPKLEASSRPMLFRHSIEVVTELLKSGANPNAEDDLGRMPLTCCPTVEFAEVLLRYGADINAVNKEGRSVVSYIENPDVAHFLLDRGAKIVGRPSYQVTKILEPKPLPEKKPAGRGRV